MPAASIFIWEVLWAKQKKYITDSWTMLGHIIPTLISVIKSTLRCQGHCLLVHYYFLCLAPSRHLMYICWLNELNSSFSMFARLTNAYSIFWYINTQSGYYRTYWPRGHFTLKLTLPVICSNIVNMDSQEEHPIFRISKFIMDAYQNCPQAPEIFIFTYSRLFISSWCNFNVATGEDREAIFESEKSMLNWF